jgi:L-malate glycosyltransferase
MKILILTSSYPLPDDKKSVPTGVVQYFARELIKQGHEVRVILNSKKYLLPLYFLPSFAKKKIATITEGTYLCYKTRKNTFFVDSGVSVNRLPISKIYPKGKFTDRNIVKQKNKILEILKSDNYCPDVVIGHWINPQLPIMNYLKKDLKSRYALIIHGDGYLLAEKNNEYSELIKSIDVIGCRSESASEDIQKILNINEKPFVCSSGVPDLYIEQSKIDVKKFSDKRDLRIVFVGKLIKRKNVDKIIESLKLAFPDKQFIFDIIGEGEEKNSLIDLSKELNLENNIIFHGRLTRDQVIEKMNNAHCFIMISSKETFGLVYLEAMLSNCIVVASKRGGVDGIIRDGVNGYLCEEGNVNELVNILTTISQIDISQKTKIATNAYNTVLNYSDSSVAKMYIENILN